MEGAGRGHDKAGEETPTLTMSSQLVRAPRTVLWSSVSGCLRVYNLEPFSSCGQQLQFPIPVGRDLSESLPVWALTPGKPFKIPFPNPPPQPWSPHTPSSDSVGWKRPRSTLCSQCPPGFNVQPPLGKPTKSSRRGPTHNRRRVHRSTALLWGVRMGSTSLPYSEERKKLRTT